MTSNQLKLIFLEETSRSSPEYDQVLTLFKRVFAYLDEREGEIGISFAPDLSHPLQRVQAGFPLLSPEAVRVDLPLAAAFLEGLLEVIGQESRDGIDQLNFLERALEQGTLDLPGLLAACLQRDRGAVEATAEHIGLQAPLLEFILETILKAALEPYAAGFGEGDFAGWQQDICPVCGSRAGMGELVGEEGRRYLCCSTCFFRWPSPRLHCPYCGNDDAQSLGYFTVDDGPTRVDVCHKCSRYLKTRDSRRGHAEVPLEAEDLATIHLDLVAGREGFARGK